MLGANLKTLVDLQSELNSVVVRYMKGITDEKLRELLFRMIARGNENIRELHDYPTCTDNK
ncbi:MAG: hypothetical protein GX964_09635 [Syntrophomonadaceae bacterium]|jgi:hypothetical protein|nr:hypothetical protein [Syntrophomonadaceae bacterium]